jgi:hypothetical protein
LSVAGLITGDREGRLIELAPEALADHIVRHLVGQGMPVFEITPEEQSLENFYLSLMKDSREQPAPKI